MNNKKYIYLCYEKSDYRLAAPILKALRERGLEVLTPSKKESDELWAQEAQSLIENAAIFMPIVTQSFVESYRCRKEVHFADAKGLLMMTLFMQQTPLNYGLALLLTAEQGLERYKHKNLESFLTALLKAKPLERLLNECTPLVTQKTFAEYLLYAVKQKEISLNDFLKRFELCQEKAVKIISAMREYGFISEQKEGGTYDVYLTEYGFELLYFKNKKSVALSNLNKNNKYLFISYAHKNSDEVLPILHFLQNERIKVWFDEGIEVGSEWPATIQQKIKECALFMPIISADFVESKNCRKEVYLADTANLNILPVFLEECELKYGLELQLAQAERVYKKDYQTEYAFKYSLANHPSVTEAAADNDNFVSYDMLISAIELMLKKGAISPLSLQPYLCIGYKRAVNIVNALLEGGLAKSENAKKSIPLITEKGLEAFYTKNKTDVLF